MVLRNYVELVPERPSRMHFTGHALVAKTIVDPVLRREKLVNTLVMTVDQLDGQPVAAQYSITSEKLAAQLFPYLEGARYKAYTFTITAHGEGYSRTYTVDVA